MPLLSLALRSALVPQMGIRHDRVKCRCRWPSGYSNGSSQDGPGRPKEHHPHADDTQCRSPTRPCRPRAGSPATGSGASKRSRTHDTGREPSDHHGAPPTRSRSSGQVRSSGTSSYRSHHSSSFRATSISKPFSSGSRQRDLAVGVRRSAGLATPLKTPSGGGVEPETAPAGDWKDLPGPSLTGLRAQKGQRSSPSGLSGLSVNDGCDGSTWDVSVRNLDR
jgi:hypothetical protein